MLCGNFWDRQISNKVSAFGIHQACTADLQTIRHYNEDAGALILNFESDNLMLDNFVEFFREHEQGIASNVRTLLSKATKSLEVKLDDTYNRLALLRHDNLRRRAT